MTTPVNPKAQQSAAGGAPSKQPEQSTAAGLTAVYKRFNDRMKLFLSDMELVYGSQSPALGDAKRQLDLFLKTDPARMRIAHAAWPLFNKHRELINNRDPDVFFKYDLGGLQAKGKLDVKTLWAKATPNSREAMWRAIEDLLDTLDDINAIRPIPVDEDDGGDIDQKKSPNQPRTGLVKSWHEALDELVPVSSLPAGDDDDSNDNSASDQPPAGPQPPKPAKKGDAGVPMEFARSLMSNLKDLIGGAGADPTVEDDFQTLLSKLNESEDGKTTAEDQATMTRILHHFIEKISPGGAGDDDAELEGMSEQEKKAEMARRSMEQIQTRIELKRSIMRLMQIDSAQETTDPVLLEKERQEEAAEQDRLKNPEKHREYTITAHFNHKLLLLLNKLHTVRGALKSTKDGRILFPGIKTAFVRLLTMFKENPGTEEVIRPVGQWVVAHRQQLLNRDDKLFLEPDHPFLVEINAPALWTTFRPHERVNFWSLVGHPLQLATIFHHLDNDSLREISDIVNDLLAADHIAYDRDPSTLNSKNVITKAVQRGCTPLKIKKIRALFERMQSEPDQRTLKQLSKLMQGVMPQAARFRNGGLSHNDDDPDVPEETAKAQAHAEQIQQTFSKILAAMPPITTAATTNVSKPAAAAAPPAPSSASTSASTSGSSSAGPAGEAKPAAPVTAPVGTASSDTPTTSTPAASAP